ncbi:hypothetical protein BaRGS_00002294, partial [Batillaria attramentaria]
MLQMLQIFLLLIAVGCAVQAASVPDLQKRHSYSPYSGYASYNSFYTAYFIYYATTPASSSCCWPIQKESWWRRLSFEDKLLNGVALDECSGNGLVGWQNVLGGDTIALCNGVVTRVDPNSPEPLVILTDPTCLQILQAIKSDPAMS